MKTLIDIFNLGMMRNYAEVLPDREGLILNLGAGKKLIPNSTPLDYPDWDAETDAIPFPDSSVCLLYTSPSPRD